jgi:hypothetical protein
MPLTADGRLVDQTPMSTQTVDMVQHAPPLYGEHILDQLYADVDQSGIMTPAPQSGMNTPFYGGLSRAGSHENLASLNEAAQPSNGAIPAAVLSSRLQNLNFGSRNNSFRRVHGAGSGSNTPHSQSLGDTDYFDQNHSGNHSGNHSNPHSNPLSRRTSEEDNHGQSQLTSGQHTPEHVDYSTLTKVPSYGTAIATPARGMSYTEAVPNYAAATSAPPSPERSFSSPATPGADIADPMRRSHPFSSFGLTPVHPPAAVHNSDNDERRRLHILQSRGRAH